MKVAIVTANYGGIDKIHVPCKQKDHEVNFICFDEKSIFPIFPDNYNNRMKYKYVKTHFLRIVPHYDMYIWIDGRIEVNSSEFVDYLVDMCYFHDIGAVIHPDRSTLAEEYDYLLKNMKTSEYLRVRYENEPFEEEIMAFKNHLGAKLYNARLFVIRHDYYDFMGAWYELIKKYTIFDQSQFTYLLDKCSKMIRKKELYWDDLHKYCKTNKHIKLI